jgi:hypothetical protein
MGIQLGGKTENSYEILCRNILRSVYLEDHGFAGKLVLI